MDNVFHECMSERGQGGTRHFQRSDKRHPYRPSIIELMEPSDPTQPRLPKYWQPWHCPDCNQFVLELVNPNPVDGRHESTENKAAVNEQDDLKVGLSPGEADSVANALEAKDKRIAELVKTNAQLNHDIGEHLDATAELMAENERLRAEGALKDHIIEAAKHATRTCNMLDDPSQTICYANISALEALEERLSDLAAAQEGEGDGAHY